MGKSKTILFSEHHNRLANWAKAIAHPARIAILEHLIRTGSCVCGDLVDVLPLSQSTVSQHLKAMKDAGIIKGEVEGTYRCYCLNTDECAQLGQSFVALFKKMTNCC